MPHPLDNPIWTSLTTAHSHLAAGAGAIKRYARDVAPFAAIDMQKQRQAKVSPSIVAADESINFVGQLPVLDSGWETELRAGVLQMIYPTVHISTERSATFSELGEGDIDAMLALTARVFPGYFRQRTPVMGRYIGIFSSDELVAMAGERMAMAGYTEISAVCTHPDYAGRGYAGALVSTLAASISARGITAFLHVSPENQRAIGLYRSLGFIERAELPLLRIRPA